jgi:hypothetical protein
MTSREKRMTVLLGIVGILFLGFAAYSLVFTPLKKYQAEQAQLEIDEATKNEELARAISQRKKLKDIQKRNLPAEITVAKREYEAAMTHIIRTAGVPPGYTIVPQDSADLGKIPLFADKSPVYSRFGYNIHLKKIDIPILVRFLKSYSDLNLLHQITKLDIKHIDKDNAAGPSRRGADRADLEVIVHTEAVILSGAEKRQTLTPMPAAVAAVAGNAAYRAVVNRPEFSRVVKPMTIEPLLAYEKGNTLATRDYLALEANDVFHGPLPKAPVRVEPEVKQPAPPRPLEDISPYIKLTSIASNSDGNFQATIWDSARNQTSEIMTEEVGGGKLIFKSRRYLFVKDRWRPAAPKEEGLLITSDPEEQISTKHTFTILGQYQDGLLLSETTTVGGAKEADPKEQPKKGGTSGRTNPFGSSKGTPPKGEAPKAKEAAPKAKETAPKAKIAGEDIGDDPTAAPAPAVAPPPEKIEKFYLWRVGQTLNTVVALPLSYRERSILLSQLGAPILNQRVEVAPEPRVNATAAN